MKIYIITHVHSGFGIERNYSVAFALKHWLEKTYPEHEFWIPNLEVPMDTPEDKAIRICNEKLRAADAAWIFAYENLSINMMRESYRAKFRISINFRSQSVVINCERKQYPKEIRELIDQIRIIEAEA